MCMEEGTQSQWRCEILSPHVKEIVVWKVGASRGPKNDAMDAIGLAEALRIGAIAKRVHKGLGAAQKPVGARRSGQDARAHSKLQPSPESELAIHTQAEKMAIDDVKTEAVC